MQALPEQRTFSSRDWPALGTPTTISPRTVSSPRSVTAYSTDRYLCSGCAFSTANRHHIQEHVTQQVCSDAPRLRRQKMQVRLKQRLDAVNMVPEAYLVASMDPANFAWRQGDATVPAGWKISRRRGRDGMTRSIFLSPTTRRILASREDLEIYLLSEGVRLAKVAGYTEKKSNCQEMCHGACSNFVVNANFFAANDPNRLRKRVNIKFVADYDIDSKNKIRDMTLKSTDNTIYTRNTLKFGQPIQRSFRPRILIPDSGKSPKLPSSKRKQVEPDSRANKRMCVGEPAHKPALGKVPSYTEDSAHGRSAMRGGQAVVGSVNVRAGRDNGVYVQCCNPACKTWRQVKEYKDDSQVPNYWVCSMNKDAINRVCCKGGNHFSGSEVNVKFARGTLVWGKLRGYPWWPGFIDYNPQSDEYFWIEEDESLTEPVRYNVIFFENETERSCAWVETENIRTNRVTSNNLTLLTPDMRKKLEQSERVAEAAQALSPAARLQRYSLSRLQGLEHPPNGKQTEPPKPKAVKSSPLQDGGARGMSMPRVINLSTIKPEQLFAKCNPAWEQVYTKPPLPSDVLITLAVRNLDPENHSGASFPRDGNIAFRADRATMFTSWATFLVPEFCWCLIFLLFEFF